MTYLVIRMTKYIFLRNHTIEVFIFQVRKQVQENSYLFGITGHKADSYACAFDRCATLLRGSFLLSFSKASASEHSELCLESGNLDQGSVFQIRPMIKRVLQSKQRAYKISWNPSPEVRLWDMTEHPRRKSNNHYHLWNLYYVPEPIHFLKSS